MKRKNNTSGENPFLLEELVEKYESEIEELQQEVRESIPPSNKLIKRTEDLRRLGNQLKNELSKVNRLYDRLEQLIGATHTSILFLDKELRIQRYTPELTRVFGQAEFKKGNLLSDVVDHSTFEKLSKHIKKITREGKQQEVEFYLRKSKKWFLTRIFSYPETIDTQSGLAITFLDVTKHKEDENRLTKLVHKLERGIQKKNKQVKKLASEIIVAEQKERKQIALLLHNDLQQQLFSIHTKVKILNEDVPEELNQKTNEIIDQISHSLDLTHQLVVSLSPPNIENNNLYKGINWLCKFIYNIHGLLVDIKGDRHIELENKYVFVLLLKMIQELLFNIVKHAGVNKAKITIQEKEEVIHICVIDEGKGFNKNKNEMDGTAHFGLSQIKEELELIEGHILIDSSPGKGTDICLTIPRELHMITGD